MRNLRLVHSDEVPPVDAAVRALLSHVRIIAPLSRAVRARALARARAALALATAADPTTAGARPPLRRC